MIEGLKPYAEYKESGLNWLGRVPARWEVRRLSIVAQFYSGKAHEQFFEAAGRHICVTARFVSTDGKARKFCTQNFCPAQKGDVLMVMSDLPNGRALARAFLVDDDASYAVNQRVCLIRANKMNPKFLAYQANRNWWLLQNDDHCNQTHLSNRDYKTLPLLSPPLTEQAAIVRFLDHANRKIDGFIRAKRKLIGLLNEQKQAIIHRAVTGKDEVKKMKDENGNSSFILQPSSFPKKPSGIPWLGHIPMHWEARKLGSLFLRHGSGTTPSGDAYYGGGVPWVMSGDLKDGRLVTTKRTVTESALKDFSALKLHPKGSLLVAMYGATIGKTGVLNMAACSNQACCALASPRSTVNPRFIQSIVIIARPHLMQQAYGGGQPNINAEVVRSLRVPLPPLAEQDSILAYMDGATIPLTTAIARTEREIALMQEYRTRLTADLVTGKLDVRAALSACDAQAGAAKLPAPPTAPAAEPAADEALEEIESAETE